MGTITTTDGTEIFYKDWGTGQPIVFSHGWPLSADDWDTQLLYFLRHGYRWTSDRFVEWLCDYGESLSRIARAFAILIVVFAVLFGFAGGLIPDGDGPPAAREERVEEVGDLARVGRAVHLVDGDDVATTTSAKALARPRARFMR